MGIKNLVQKTVFSLLVAAIVMAVLIPSAYFVTLSFSSNYEAYQFPSRMFPQFSYDAKFHYNESEDSYSLLIRRGGEYESVKTDYDTDRMLRYMRDQLNVEWSQDQLAEVLHQARAQGEVSLKMQKSMFRNYRVFLLLAVLILGVLCYLWLWPKETQEPMDKGRNYTVGTSNSEP